jgi:hypothetical protein
MNFKLYNFKLYSLGLLSLGSGLFIYGTSIIHRQYCIFCGKATPCIAGSYCNATRLEGKVIRYLMKKISTN